MNLTNEAVYIERKRAKLGEKVLSFAAKGIDKDGNQITWNIDDNFKSKKWTVLFFYPAAFTVVCPTEIKAFSKLSEAFAKEGADLVGASVDSSIVHLNWIRSSLGQVNIPLISDQNTLISEYFGIRSADLGIAWRGTFIISPTGMLYVNYSTFGEVGRSAKETLRLLQASKVASTGRMVPCEWQPGEETL